MRSRTLAVASFVSFLPLAAAAADPRPSPAPPEETRISIDFKDADILDIVRLMAEVGDFQVVADPGITCKLTLNLKQVPLQTAFDVILRSCGLAYESEGGIVRVAPAAKLTAERILKEGWLTQ